MSGYRVGSECERSGTPRQTTLTKHKTGPQRKSAMTRSVCDLSVVPSMAHTAQVIKVLGGLCSVGFGDGRLEAVTSLLHIKLVLTYCTETLPGQGVKPTQGNHDKVTLQCQMWEPHVGERLFALDTVRQAKWGVCVH